MCLHSGELRALQTDELVAAAVAGGRVESRNGLAPNDPITPAVEWLVARPEDASIAVVGHPTLSTAWHRHWLPAIRMPE